MSASPRSQKLVEYWSKLIKKSVAEKRKRAQTFVMLAEAFSKDAVQVTKVSAVTRSGKYGKRLERVKGAISGKELIADTQDLMDFYVSTVSSDDFFGFKYQHLGNYSELFLKCPNVFHVVFFQIQYRRFPLKNI